MFGECGKHLSDGRQRLISRCLTVVLLAILSLASVAMAQRQSSPATLPPEDGASTQPAQRIARPEIALPVDELLGVYTPDRYWLLLSAFDATGRDETLPERFGWRTLVRTRPTGPKAEWREQARFTGGISAAAAYREGLAVLRPDGSWARVTDTGLAVGALPPAGWVLTDLAGASPRAADRQQLWALAYHSSGRRALFTYDGEWTKLADLPLEDVTQAEVAHAGRPVVLVIPAEGEPASAFAWTGQKLEPLASPPLESGQMIRLIDAANPTIVVDVAGAPPFLLLLTDDGWQRRAVQLAEAASLEAGGGADQVPPAGEERFTVVGTPDGYRLLLVVRDGDRYAGPFEQVLDSAGQPLGALRPLPAPRSPQPPQDPVMMVLLVVMLLLVTLSAFRQRQERPEVALTEQRWELAPHSRRLVGGVVDLLPVLLAAGWLWLDEPDAQPLAQPGAMPTLLGIAIGVHIGVTLLTELLTGRSPGKWLVGLRVVSVDGQKPAAMPVVTRNLLRLFDLLLMMVPTVFVVVSPLRQRIGDMAGGTVVVRAERKPEAETDGQQSLQS